MKPRKHPAGSLLRLIAFSSALVAGELQAVDYFRFASLGSLQPIELQPYSYRSHKINASGSVVGNLGNEAAIWKAGVVTQQGIPSSATYSRGHAINSTDSVAIQINNKFFMEENSAAVKHGGNYFYTSYPPNIRFTVPYGINDSRLMVGAASVAAGIPGRAFFVPAGGDVPTLLPNGTGTINSVALDANNGKIICGVSFLSVNNPVAMLWVADESGDGEMLGDVGGDSSAQDVSDHVQVVGHHGNLAAYWNSAGLFTIAPGIANAITNSGKIVGSSVRGPVHASSRAWFKSSYNAPVNNLTALQDSGHILYTASDINENLQIVGISDAGGYILTPVLERWVPGAWDDTSRWMWEVKPTAAHPVRIVADTADLTVTGPAAPASVSELTVGYPTGSPVATLDLAAGSSLQVVANPWGNGETKVMARGSLVVDGQLQSPVEVIGSLSGSGTVTGNLVVKDTGILSPGRTSGSLIAGSGLSMESGSSLRIDINGQGAETVADRLTVTGNVSLTDPELVFSGSYLPVAGETFTILQNNSSGPVSGNFENLPEGTAIANFMGSGLVARIHYTGGDGNDVTLSVTEPASANADLTSLSLDPGLLNPVFDSDTGNYAAEVDHSAVSTVVAAVTVDPEAVVSINAKAATPGSQTETVPLVVGMNEVEVLVTASDSTTIRHYRVNVARLSIIQSWRKARFGSPAGEGEQADLADADDDGLLNLLEFAMGTDPESGIMGPLKYSGGGDPGGVIEKTGQPVILQSGGQRRAFFIRLSASDEAGLVYKPMSSADCATWEPITTEPEILADNGIYQVVSVPFPVAVGSSPGFFRVEVELVE